MFTLHCTQKLLDRIKPRLDAPGATKITSTTTLGNWYATVLLWKPQWALCVNERSLLPVLVPLAPAATVVQRFPDALQAVLQALELPDGFIRSETAAMDQVTYAKTANRQVLGVMNEFVRIADVYRDPDGPVDPLALALKLAHVPCGPLYKGAVFPDRAVRELALGGPPH